MMRKTIKKLIFISSLFLSNTILAGDDLLEVYYQALKHDPTFQAAFSNKLAAEENYPQARALFLPFLSAAASYTNTRTFTDRFDTSSAQATFFLNGEFSYHTKSSTLSLKQNVFNYQNWAKLQQANATVKGAVATFNAALQTLIVNVSNSYFDVLQAQDTLRFTQAEKRANKRQLEQAQHRFKVGLDAITSVYNAQASYDAVNAKVISAKNDVINAKEKLREITGKYHTKLATFTQNLPLLNPEPNQAMDWVNTAKRRNFSLIASRHAAESARANVDAQFAGHLPTLDVTGQYTANRGGSAGSGGIYTKNKILALELNIPILEGGLVNSQARQAVYQHDAAKADYEKLFRQVVSNTNQSYNSVIAGIATVRANRQAVKSARSSLKSNQAAFNVGTRTIVDVLIAQKDLYNAQRALAKSDYDYLRAMINLKNAAGTLNLTDIEEINSWLKTQSAHSTFERFKKHGTYRHGKSKYSEVPIKQYHTIYRVNGNKKNTKSVSHKTKQKTPSIKKK